MVLILVQIAIFCLQFNTLDTLQIKLKTSLTNICVVLPLIDYNMKCFQQNKHFLASDVPKPTI